MLPRAALECRSGVWCSLFTLARICRGGVSMPAITGRGTISTDVKPAPISTRPASPSPNTAPWASARLWYRVSRHPLVANLILPPLVFLVLYRLPFDMPKGWRRERIGVYATNLALAALIAGVGLAVGFGRVAAVQLPVTVLASIIGVWLFTVQHRGEDTSWARQDQWDPVTASLHSSTYLRLGRVLQWFTGNIGLPTCTISTRASPTIGFKRATMPFPS